MERAVGQWIVLLLVAGGSALSVWSAGTVLARERPETRRTLWTVMDTADAAIQSPRDYMGFLEVLGSSDTEKRFAPSVVRRHLDAVSVVAPEPMVERLRIHEGTETGRVKSLVDSAGSTLTRWWRRQDPYPATPYNERLREHLQRTIEAFERYSREDTPNRLDDRGRVYVRFGAPDRRRDLDMGKKGEFWVYASHSAAEYVFVRDRGDGYKLAPPTDILPERLRRGFGPSTRGLRKAVKGLSMLEHVYEQLAHFRSRYGITFSDLSMYKEQVRQAKDGLPTSFNVRPHTFAQQKIREIRHEEAEATRRRTETLPRTQSEAGDEFEDLPIAVRWIRSLTETDSTQVRLYWSVARASLQSSNDHTESSRDRGRRGDLLSSSLVQFSPTYERQSVRTRHLFTPENGGPTGGTLDPQQAQFMLGKTSHAALQVDLSRASIEGRSESVRTQAKLKVGTSRADSLQPLSDDPSVLEMSDLEPVLLRTDSTSVETAPVYPFREVSPPMPLALRFEIYHLSKDAKGHTQYGVEYEVFRKTDRGTFERFFRGDEQERTAVQSRVEGQKARTQEYVLLDPKNWTEDEAQTVRVTVEITDERTGERVSRAVEFDLPPTNR